MVLTVERISHAERFLRLSQRELHLNLNTLKLEYLSAIRRLAEEATYKRFSALRDSIKLLDSQIQPEPREAFVCTWISRPHEVTEVY